MPPLTRLATDHRLRNPLALCIWILFAILFIAITWQGVLAGRNSVVPSYRHASELWLRGEPIYQLDTIHGFLYLPSAAALSTPLAFLPTDLHELLWRLLSLSVLAWAAWRLAKVLQPATGPNTFLIMTVLVLPVSVGSLRSGQMNLILAATIALGCAETVVKRYGWASFWLALGFALKPQAIVAVLLFAALEPKLRLRLALALLLALAFPFLLQRPDYVAQQYLDCWRKFHLSGNPTDYGAKFNDLFGLLTALGWNVPQSGQWTIRILAAPLTLALAWTTARHRDRLHGILAALAAAACYLMLFNPRTEGGSYIVAAIPLAAYATWEGQILRRYVIASILILITLGWTASYDLSRALWESLRLLGMQTSAPDFGSSNGSFWLSPLLALLFTAYLAYIVIRNQGPHESTSPKPLAPPALNRLNNSPRLPHETRQPEGAING